MRCLGLVRVWARVKLDEIIKILGLSGKPKGLDGSRIEAMVLDGQGDRSRSRSSIGARRKCAILLQLVNRLILIYEP
jgi:hypothetical protein